MAAIMMIINTMIATMDPTKIQITHVSFREHFCNNNNKK